MKELFKELLKDKKSFHITIKHGNEIIFDNDTDCAFVVAEEGDAFHTTCYNNTDINTTLNLVKTCKENIDKVLEKLAEKILGD